MKPPDHNPKTRLGLLKVPMHLVPPVAIAHEAMALKNGAEKYGAYNWRKEKISSSVYYDAAMRHLMAWWDGEEVASDSGVHHLAHARACLGLVLDAMGIGKLNDDRPESGSASATLAALAASAAASVHASSGQASASEPARGRRRRVR